MSYTRVKICGITRPEDAALAAEHGTDAIGLNFFAGPRKIDKTQAQIILRHIPTLVTPIGLTAMGLPSFPNAPSIHEIRCGSPCLRIDTFQIYGELPDETVEGDIRTHCWIVFRVNARLDISNMAVQLAVWGGRIEGVVLDTAATGMVGGSGKTFNWHWLAEARAAGELEGLPPIILAGGLTADNVAEAIRIVHPYAVDVSSGVEVPGKPGIKDPIKVRDFIQAAHSA